jgi:NAD+ kinase
MSALPPILRRVALAAHPKLPEGIEIGRRLAASLQAIGSQTLEGLLGEASFSRRIEAGEIDLLVALGGDGTMLRAGHLCAPNQVPILGINLGKFGFLTEISQEQWEKVLPRLMNGEYWLEKRMMLCAEHLHAGKVVSKWDVLNEVVVGRGQIVRPVHLITEVDGRLLTTYVADGLIVATATGSTAYALAAGGPIVPPELKNMLLIPLAPHLCLERAIVLSQGSVVRIVVRTDHVAILTIDGQYQVELADGDRVEVRASPRVCRFIRLQDRAYFYRTLMQRLGQPVNEAGD